MNKLLVVLMLAVMCGAQEKPKNGQPTRLEFRNSAATKIVFVIKSDGTLEMGDAYKPDQAAKLFWEYVEETNPFTPLKARISELEKENKELKRKLSNDKGCVNAITGETPGITLK